MWPGMASHMSMHDYMHEASDAHAHAGTLPAPCWLTAFLGTRRQWHRNQDSEMIAVDSTYIIRNTTLCPNKMGAQAYRTGMMPGLTMSTATA